jgi:hypothetical protein
VCVFEKYTWLMVQASGAENGVPSYSDHIDFSD